MNQQQAATVLRGAIYVIVIIVAFNMCMGVPEKNAILKTRAVGKLGLDAFDDSIVNISKIRLLSRWCWILERSEEHTSELQSL